MPIIKVADAKPGMILDEDVIQDGRNVLVNKGQKIDQRLMQMLENRGVTEIRIQDEAGESEQETAATSAKPSGPETSGPIPKISVYITQDQMGATVSVETQTPEDRPLTIEILKKALVNAGVVYGYLDNEIQNVIRRFNSTKDRIQNSQVARGKLASSGKQGEVNIVVPHVSNTEDYQRVSSCAYACEIPGIVREGMRVDTGSLIAKRLDEIPPQPGMDVCGETVDIEDVEKTPVKLGSNVEASEDDTSFKSSVSGVVCYADKTLSVYPLNFDARAELTISDDKMEAILNIQPPSERGNSLKLNAIESLLAEKKITFGILRDDILGGIRDATAGNQVNELVVARGRAAVNGEDGSIEFLFDIEGKAKPKTLEDGSVDYKNIKLVESADEGQELARLIPPGEGQPGCDIFGEEIPCEPGTAAQLPVGPNTAPREDDDQVLVATAAGNVRVRNNLIEVSEGFSVPGDVDFSTGNIEYPKSVVVKGDIKGGFTVEAGGDLEIGGTVEDATIMCGGNVLVKCGFIGSGKGVVNAKGNVTIAFIRNQEVRSRQDIFVAREAIGARLWSKNNIEVLGKPFSIAGGKISARNEVKAYTIGNENGVRTEVEVGIDFTLVEEMGKTEDKIKELNLSHKKVADNLQKLRHLKQLKKQLQPKEEFLLKKLEAMENKINTQLEALEKRKQVIGQKLKEVGKARIWVERSVFPGTVIKIGDRHMVVNKEIIGPKSIMLLKGEIKTI